MATYGQTGMGKGLMADEQSASKMMEEAPPAPAAAGGGWVVDAITIKQSANGGFVVTSSKRQEPPSKDGPGYQSKDYTFASLEEAAPFVMQEFGVGRAPAAAPPSAAPLEPEPDEASEMMA